MLHAGPVSLEDVEHVAERVAEHVVERAMKRARLGEDTGVASGTISLSVKGASEMQMWDEHVKDKVGSLGCHAMASGMQELQVWPGKYGWARSACDTMACLC